MRLNLSSREQGFTLVELMIVVAIIGILAAIAIPNFQTYQAKARQTEAKLALSSVYMALTSFQAEKSSFTSCLSPAGAEPPTRTKILYSVGFTAAAGNVMPCGSTGADFCQHSDWGPVVGTVSAADGDVGCAGAALATALVDTAYLGAAQPQAFAANFKVATDLLVPAAMLDTMNLPGTAIDRATFTAAALGSISNTAMIDTWTVDNLKTVRNTVVGF